jgi:uncharacterized protein YacL (UPF0231 family)
MTTKKDTLELREKELGSGQELTVGVPDNGMQNASGDLPKRDYNYGSSLNKAAVGQKVNKLYTAGGEVGVPLNINPQRPSQYPCNQIDETPSGHSIEFDDTPGGERVMIRHRKGAGIEMRADGSVIISATNNKVEVTGGDQTVIVEGHGNLIYNGNLNLKVSGDFNVDIGGNYNVNVAGNQVENIKRNHKTTVEENSHYITKGTKNTKTVGTHTDIMLADNNQIVNGNQQNIVEGNVDLFSEEKIFISGKEQFAVSAKVANIAAAKQISVFGQKGVIGGKEVDFTGKSYYGSKGEVEGVGDSSGSNAIFWGTFKGVATESIRSVNADFADHAKKAFDAQTATTAGSLGAGGSTVTNPTVVATSLTQESISGQNAPITPDLVVDHTLNGSYAIQTVVVDADDILKNSLNIEEKYNFVFRTTPTMQEIRSAFRNEDSRNTVSDLLVSEGRLNPDYKNIVPPAIGRTVSKKASSRYGYTPIGNAIENRGKRFRP